MAILLSALKIFDYLPQKWRVTKYDNDLRILINTRDWIGRQLLVFGVYKIEETHTNFVKQYLSKLGGTFIDIGANIGYYSLMASKRCNRVISIEPHPFTMAQLNFNIALNNIKNIETRQIGLTNRRKNMKIYDSFDENQATASFYKPNNKNSYLINCYSFDSLFYDVVERQTLIKIDVEGSELEVLRGMKRTLRDKKPDLLIEIDKKTLACAKSTYQDVQAILEKHKYYFYRITKNGLVREIVLPYDSLVFARRNAD